MTASRSVRTMVLTTLLAAIAAVAPAASFASVSCPGADVAATAATVAQVRAAVLCETNAERASRGLRELRENPRLRRAALAHSSSMVSDQYFGHTTLGGATFSKRILRTGYARKANRWTVGENLAWGTKEFSTAAGAQTAWMNSSPHKANIVKSAYREIGIGIRLGTPTDAAVGATFTIDFGVTS